MSEQIISIDNPANLSINIGRLTIKQGEKTNYIAIIDIATLILSNQQINLSAPVISSITEGGGLVVFTNSSYMPSTYCYANNVNNKGAIRPYFQAKAIHSPMSGKAWQQIIKSKIIGQSLVLEKYKTQSYELIKAYAMKVELGDHTNVEALVARCYWENYFKLFNININREKQGASNIINICLNYGYTVVRSMVARSLASLGLCLNFGVGHYRKDNPFNLVEDMIEPFRYIVDKIVLSIVQSESLVEFQIDTLQPKIKQALIQAIYNTTLSINRKQYRLIQAIHTVSTSYCNYLEGTTSRLLLPNTDLAGKTQNINTELENY